MKTWSLADAHQDFADVAKRAVAHQPQRIELDGETAVVLVNASDYAMLAFARDLVDFVRRNSFADRLDRDSRSVPVDLLGDRPLPTEDR